MNSIDKGQGVETTANRLSQKNVRLEAMEGNLTDKFSRQFPARNHMKRNRSDDLPSSGFKRPKKQESLGTSPSLQLALIDRTDLDGKISPERWKLIEERFIEFMMKESWLWWQ